MQQGMYLRLGETLLPGLAQWQDVIAGKPIAVTDIKIQDSLGLCRQIGCLPDYDLKNYGAGRMLRKSSERQARWLVEAAAASWQRWQLTDAADVADATGIFVGFDVVECDDGAEACFAFEEGMQEYVEFMLSETKPLNGLTLLSSTAISHIAQLLNIRGAAAGFSPFADAAAQALIEAQYAIAEGQCQQVLLVAGGSKITPWYFLRYRELLKARSPLVPIESAGAMLLSDKAQHADSKVLFTKRFFAVDETSFYAQLDRCLNDWQQSPYPMHEQLIVTGEALTPWSVSQQLPGFIPNAQLCDLDQLIGYSGAAGGLHALQLATVLQKQQRCIATHTTEPAELTGRNSPNSLIVALGAHGQVCLILLGEVDDE